MLFRSRTDLAASVGLVGAGVSTFLVGTLPMSFPALVGVFAFAGLIFGVVRPARDMMIRKVAPKGATGQVFGFVFSGQSVGGGVAPVVFGLMLDYDHTEWIYYTSAFFMLLCVVIMVASEKANQAAQAAQQG